MPGPFLLISDPLKKPQGGAGGISISMLQKTEAQRADLPGVPQAGKQHPGTWTHV